MRSCEAQEQFSSPWQLTDEGSFYAGALRPNWKTTYVDRGSTLYVVIFSDGGKTKRLLSKEEVTTWPTASNALFVHESKPFRIVRLENLDGDAVWEGQKGG